MVVCCHGKNGRIIERCGRKLVVRLDSDAVSVMAQFLGVKNTEGKSNQNINIETSIVEVEVLFGVSLDAFNT